MNQLYWNFTSLHTLISVYACVWVCVCVCVCAWFYNKQFYHKHKFMQSPLQSRYRAVPSLGSPFTAAVTSLPKNKVGFLQGVLFLHPIPKSWGGSMGSLEEQGVRKEDYGSPRKTNTYRWTWQETQARYRHFCNPLSEDTRNPFIC